MRRTLTLLRTNTLKTISPVAFSRSNSFQHQGPTSNNANGPLTGINPDNYDYYASLRIYQNHNWLELSNLLVMTTICSNTFFVDNCHRIYELSKRIFGANITDYGIATTIGRIFTAGDTLKTMDKFVKEWKYPQVNLLIGYSNEIPPGQEARVEDLNESARIFADTVDMAVVDPYGNNGMAIKCSCLIHPTIMKKANESQVRLRAVFSDGYGNLTQTYTAKQLSDRLRELNVDFTFADFQEFMSSFLHKGVTSENMGDVKITKFEWLRDMHMFYVENSHKNINKILRQITQLEDQDLIELEHYSQRLKLVFDRAAKTKCPVLVDAEQSYYQETIDSFAFQYMAIYNKGDKAFILNTYQNYLKITKEKLAFELQRCKDLGTPLGAKMVRGAYMVEERSLASKYGYEDPVQPTLDDTHNNYNGNIEFLIKNWIPGSHLIIASHNERTVTLAKDVILKHDIGSAKNPGTVMFGQLLGLGDHLTFSLASQGFPVAKYVAFGPVPILIPFFVRRAQETKQMFQSTGLQRSLVMNEMKHRVSRRK